MYVIVVTQWSRSFVLADWNGQPLLFDSHSDTGKGELVNKWRATVGVDSAYAIPVLAATPDPVKEG